MVAFLALLAITIGIFTALTLVVVGLVETPWPLLLAGLIAVLYGFQRLSASQSGGNPTRVSQPLPTETSAPAPPSTPPTAANQTPEAAPAQASPSPMIYRGVPVASPPPSAPPPPAPTTPPASENGMVYRGIRYGSADTAANPRDTPPPSA